MRYSTKLVLFIFSLLALPGLLSAQQKCGTVDFTRNYQTLQGKIAFEQWLTKRTKQRKENTTILREKSTYKIPVVVHVIHNGEAVGQGTNLSDAQVMSQIAVLNEDYKRLNSDAANTRAEFLPVAGSIDLEFVLAKQTPDGLPTNGIVRVNGHHASWTSGNDSQFKALSIWDTNKYLNIWVLHLTDYLGYSQFPISDLPGLEGTPDDPSADGVVIDYTVFGSVDYGNFNLDNNYNKGRTTTHEIGHFLGLRHIWSEDGPACGGVGDYVADTPDQASNTSGCPTGTPTSCNVHSMFQNYMDYTDDACMNLFTKDQIDRMVTVLENSPRRVSLLTSDGLNDPPPLTTENLTLEGVVSPVVTCNSTTDIVINVKNSGVEIHSCKILVTTPSGVLTFSATDLTLAPGAEQLFTLPGVALPQGATTVHIALTEPNGATDTYTNDDAIDYKIVVNSAQDFLPLVETFDDNYSSRWTITNPMLGMEWVEFKTNYNNSLYFNGFSNPKEGDRAWLVSPVLDLSNLTEASMFFDLSYGFRNGTADNFKVLASTNCGATFDVTLFDESGTSIAGSPSNARWEPSGTDEWDRRYVSLTSLVGNANVRLAFVFTNGNGNNLYIDNIEFYTTDNPTPPVVENSFSVYPNPGTGIVSYVTLHLPEREHVRITVTDVQGRSIMTDEIEYGLNQTFTIPLLNVNAGIYIVSVVTPKKTSTQKLLVFRH